MAEIVFITGTDTGVGKTVLTALLLTHLREQGVHALALKPFCSGGPRDVRWLRSAQAGELSDREINPWFFELPVAPLIAAQAVGVRVKMSEVVERIQEVAAACDVLLVEGAGGLLVPLGHHYTVADVIAALRCSVILVARNALGTVNHTLLSLAYLRQLAVHRSRVVLMNPGAPDLSAQTNAQCIEQFGRQGAFTIPFLGRSPASPLRLEQSSGRAKKTLAQICRSGIFSSALGMSGEKLSSHRAKKGKNKPCC